MLEVVQTYVDTHDIAKVVAKQNEILALYRLDIAKYAEGSDKPKIRAIFDAIPFQLNDKNRRFFLNHVEPNDRQLRYANSFEWLAQAGGISLLQCDRTPATFAAQREAQPFQAVYGGCGASVYGPVWRICSLPSSRATCPSIWGES